MTDKCKNCPTRKAFAKEHDVHFYGEDCPYVCEGDAPPEENNNVE